MQLINVSLNFTFFNLKLLIKISGRRITKISLYVAKNFKYVTIIFKTFCETLSSCFIP